MAGLGDRCQGKQRYGDPAPYAWSVSFGRPAVVGDGEKRATATETSTVEVEWALLDASGAVSGLQGKRVDAVDRGDDAGRTETEFLTDVTGNMAAFKAAVERARSASGMKGLKTSAPSDAMRAEVTQCN